MPVFVFSLFSFSIVSLSSFSRYPPRLLQGRLGRLRTLTHVLVYLRLADARALLY